MRTRSSKELKGRIWIISAALTGPMCFMRSSSSTVAEFTSTCPALQPLPLGSGSGGGAGVGGGSGVAVGKGVAVGGGTGVAVGTGVFVG